MRFLRALLGMLDALVGIALLPLAGAALARGVEAVRGGTAADVAVAVLVFAVLGFAGTATFFAGWVILPASAAGERARRAARVGCAAGIAVLALLSLAAVFSGDTLTWLLLIVTFPPLLLLSATWVVLREPGRSDTVRRPAAASPRSAKQRR